MHKDDNVFRLLSNVVRRGSIAFVLGLLPLAAGCNNMPTGDIVPTVPAGGVVTFQGKPLEHYQVLLQAEDQRPASGMTDADGNFVLGTNGKGDGAPVGMHKVAVRYVGPPDFDPESGGMEFKPMPPPKVKIPAKYSSIESSGLTVEVPSDGNIEIDLKLQ